MKLRFAGVDLCLEDPDGDVMRWLDTYLPIFERQAFAKASWDTDRRFDARCNNGRAVGLPVPPWTQAPAPRINTLYWPSGASRWARMFALVTKDQWDEIRKTVFVRDKQGVAADLEFGEDDGESLTVKMWALTPIPIHAPAFADEGAFILPLVDDRYWWQFSYVEDFWPDEWSDAIDDIETALDSGDLAGDVHEDYGKPSGVEWRRDRENAAMLLDALASGTGSRVVRHFDGTTELQTPSVASSLVSSNFESGVQRVAGGSSSQALLPPSSLPEKFQVTFRENECPSVVGYVAEHKTADIWTETDVIQSTMSGVAFVPGRTKTWHTTATEPLPADGEEPEDEWPDKLAKRAAIDYLDWMARRYHFSLAGIANWLPTGYDDWIEWRLGSRGKGGEYDCVTICHSMPENFGTENLPIRNPEIPKDESCCDRVYCRITTKNCCVSWGDGNTSASSIPYEYKDGFETDSHIVKANWCDVTGKVKPNPKDIYVKVGGPSDGCLFYDCVCEVVPSTEKVTVLDENDEEIEEPVWATVSGTVSTTYGIITDVNVMGSEETQAVLEKANLFDGMIDHEIEVTTVDDLGMSGPYTEGQRIIVAWLKTFNHPRHRWHVVAAGCGL